MKKVLENLLGEVNDLLIDADAVSAAFSNLEHSEDDNPLNAQYLPLCRIVVESYKMKLTAISNQLDLLIFKCVDCLDEEAPVVFRVESSF